MDQAGNWSLQIISTSTYRNSKSCPFRNSVCVCPWMRECLRKDLFYIQKVTINFFFYRVSGTRLWNSGFHSLSFSTLTLACTLQLPERRIYTFTQLLLKCATVSLLVVQHDVRHPDELRRNSDGRHVVEVGGAPLQLVVGPFLPTHATVYRKTFCWFLMITSLGGQFLSYLFEPHVGRHHLILLVLVWSQKSTNRQHVFCFTYQYDRCER